jgi:5-methyltetrahydropteroyltriglutamate--homocysteine methyltransferase
MAVWQQAKLPPGKTLMSGVVSHATNLVEHPQLFADRIRAALAHLPPERLIRLPIAARRTSRAPSIGAQTAVSASANLAESKAASAEPTFAFATPTFASINTSCWFS